MDPRTKQSDTEVQKIMHLQEIANQLPDAFIDTKRVTKSYILAANSPTRVEIPNKQAGDNIAQESQKRLKRGRPIGSKDKNPRKRKRTEKNSDHEENVLNETQGIKTSPEEEMNDMNKEMSNYSQTNILWDRNKIGDIDEIFSYFVASDIMGGDDDPEPKSVIDCQSRPDWDKWKDAIQAELDSLNKRKGFGPIVTIPRDVKPVGCRWIFVQKRNEKNEVTRYLISLAVSKNLEMRLMDVVTAYLYGSIDSDIYIKIPEGFKIPESLSSKPKDISLSVDNDPFRPCEEDEDVLGSEVPYLSAIGALISQTGYIFLNGGTAISWRSQKQTLVATSSNHAEVNALHEASRECVWLRSMTQLIVTSCGLKREESPTLIYEDNAACVAQMKEGYIKSDRTKHIPQRYFAYTQDLIKDNQIEMKYVQSSNNSADLFTKALPTSVFRKHVHAIGMRYVQKR
ncbi:retrovirus-related pol polyprotein from transposon TNT 1-94 [Tanacetum coccineum]